MSRFFGTLLLLLGTVFGWITYSAFFVIHYDLDPVSVLAYLLNITIPTLGWITSVLTILTIGFGIVLWRR